MKNVQLIFLAALALLAGCGAGDRPPVARDVRIEGLPSVGNVLTVQYVYDDPDGDAEGATEIVWKSGEEVVKLGPQLEVVPEFDGRPLQAWVRPRDARGRSGEAVAAANGPVVAGYGLLPEAVPFLRPFAPPACDPADPEVFFIRTSADWVHVNDTGKRVFCVVPGDYGNLGEIVITQSGTPEAPRYLLLASDDPRHPAAIAGGDFADKTGWEDKLARYRLVLDRADYWVIDRPAYWEDPSPFAAPLELEGASHNLINRAFYVDTAAGIGLTGGSHENTVQNVHMEKTRWAVDYARSLGADPPYERQIFADLAALELEGAAPGNRFLNNVFVNNEVINYADAFQAVRGAGAYVDNVDPDPPNPPLDGAGTVVAGNLFYVTPLIYTDGDGGFDEDGGFALAENALDFKFGSLDPQNPVRVLGNVMFGYRPADASYADLDDEGYAMVFHFGAGNLEVARNYVLDAQLGYGADGPRGGDPAIYAAVFRDNVFYGLREGVQRIYGSDREGVYDGAVDLLLERNVFGRLDPAFEGPSLHAYNTRDLVVRGNVFAESRGMWFGYPANASTGLVIEDNLVYDTPDWFESIPDYARASGNRELSGPFDYEPYRTGVVLRRFTAAPVFVTVP